MTSVTSHTRSPEGRAPMTEHMANLERARQRLVEERRSLAERLAQGEEAAVITAGNRLAEIQRAIGAIDEAIVEERRANPNGLPRIHL